MIYEKFALPERCVGQTLHVVNDLKAIRSHGGSKNRLVPPSNNCNLYFIHTTDKI